MKRPDRLMLFSIVILVLLGVVFVLDASVAEAYQQFNDKYYFAKQQLLWAGLGLAALGISSFVPLKLLRYLGKFTFYASMISLVAVLIPGIGTEVQGARRWLVFSAFRIQPAELMKLSMVLYFSSWLTKHQRLLPFMFFTGIIFLLLMLQPDLGTALVLSAIAITLFVVAEGKWRDVLIMGGVGILGVIALVLISPYRLERVKTFLHSEGDPLGSSYHIRQITIALGSGGWLGQGIGKSRQKYQYIPEASTDSIFSIAAEEVGFLGSFAVIALFATVTISGFKIAERTSDKYAKFVASGITAWLAAQTLINLGSIVSLIPLTGVPLPFISYGGSSLVSVLAASGILIGIGRRSS